MSWFYVVLLLNCWKIKFSCSWSSFSSLAYILKSHTWRISFIKKGKCQTCAESFLLYGLKMKRGPFAVLSLLSIIFWIVLISHRLEIIPKRLEACILPTYLEYFCTWVLINFNIKVIKQRLYKTDKVENIKSISWNIGLNCLKLWEIFF